MNSEFVEPLTQQIQAFKDPMLSIFGTLLGLSVVPSDPTDSQRPPVGLCLLNLFQLGRRSTLQPAPQFTPTPVMLLLAQTTVEGIKAIVLFSFTTSRPPCELSAATCPAHIPSDSVMAFPLPRGPLQYSNNSLNRRTLIRANLHLMMR